jgi:hypothetical protein
MGIIKFNSAYAVQWAKTIPQINIGSFNSFAVGSTGNMAAGGQDNPGYTKGAIGFITSTPTLSWVRTIVTGSNPDYRNTGVCIDSSDNVYAVGYGINTSTGAALTYLVKYNSAGTLQWQRRITLTGTCATEQMVQDSSTGDLYITGYEYASTPNTNSVVVMKYNSSGTRQWAKKLTSGSSTVNLHGQSIARGGSGNIYVAGYVGVVGGTNRGLIIKLDSSGNLIWQRELRLSTVSSPASGPTSSTLSIGTNGTDDIVFVGFNFENADTPVGMLLKLPADGSKTGTNVISSDTLNGSVVLRFNYNVTTYTWDTSLTADAAGAFTFASPAVVALNNTTGSFQSVPIGTETILNDTNTIV